MTVGIVCARVFTSSWPARVVTGEKRKGLATQGINRLNSMGQSAAVFCSTLTQLPGMFLIILWICLALMGAKRLVKQ